MLVFLMIIGVTVSRNNTPQPKNEFILCLLNQYIHVLKVVYINGGEECKLSFLLSTLPLPTDVYGCRWNIKKEIRRIWIVVCRPKAWNGLASSRTQAYSLYVMWIGFKSDLTCVHFSLFCHQGSCISFICLCLRDTCAPRVTA